MLLFVSPVSLYFLEVMLPSKKIVVLAVTETLFLLSFDRSGLAKVKLQRLRRLILLSSSKIERSIDVGILPLKIILRL